MAQILASCVKRSGELVARYGGEEFALLLPGADEHEAALVAQRCNDEMEKARIAHGDSSASPWLSLSIGVSTAIAQQDMLPEALLEAADSALYRAKDSGRGCVETAAGELALV